MQLLETEETYRPSVAAPQPRLCDVAGGLARLSAPPPPYLNLCNTLCHQGWCPQADFYLCLLVTKSLSWGFLHWSGHPVTPIPSTCSPDNTHGLMDEEGASPLLGSSGCPAEVEVLSKGRLCGQRYSRTLVLSLTPGRGHPGPRGVWRAKAGVQMETGVGGG